MTTPTDPTTLSLPDLARWYAAQDWWRWTFGMLVDVYGKGADAECWHLARIIDLTRNDNGEEVPDLWELDSRLNERHEEEWEYPNARPWLLDDATIGCLPSLVSEVLGGPVSVDHEVVDEVGVTLHTRETRTYVGSASGPTLAHALAALVVGVRRG